MSSCLTDMTTASHPLEQFHFCPRCGSSHFNVHDFKSKRCADCGFTYYFNPSAATVAVIVDEHGRLLTCRRAKEPAKGTLDLPGGFVDPGESNEEGLLREVREETGASVTIERFLFSLPNTYLFSGFLVHTADCFFLCRPVPGACLEAHDDATDLQWMPFDCLEPEQFGLHSVCAGVRRLLAMHRNPAFEPF